MSEYKQVSLTWEHRKQYGLDTWVVLLDGRVLHQYLSEASARRAWQRLAAKLGVTTATL